MKRVDEDALRILRFIRFYAHLGNPPPDLGRARRLPRPGAEIGDAFGRTDRAELLRLMEAHDPASVLLLMRARACCATSLPEAAGFRPPAGVDLPRDARHSPPPHRGRCAASAGVGCCPPGTAAAVAGRLKLSNAQGERLADLVAARRGARSGSRAAGGAGATIPGPAPSASSIARCWPGPASGRSRRIAPAPASPGSS